jgi:PhnB protein
VQRQLAALAAANDNTGRAKGIAMTAGIPPGFHTATPYLMVPDADSAITFYKKAFGATELKRFAKHGKTHTAEIKIGSSPVMLGGHAEVYPSLNNLPLVSIYLYVEDADTLFAQAIAAGAHELYPVREQFYGNREGGLVDPFGVGWWIATQIEDLSAEELQRRVEAAG